MASIYKNNGFYYISYYDPVKRKFISRTTGLKATKANKFLAYQKLEEIKKRYTTKCNEFYTKQITLKEIAKEYIIVKELKPKSISLLNLTINKFISINSELPVVNYTKAHYINFISELRLNKYSQNTISIYSRQLRALWNYAVKTGIIETNIIEATKTELKEIITISDKDLQVIFSNVNNKTHLLFLKFLLLTGFRISTAIAITYNDIDLKNNIIRTPNIKVGKIQYFPIYSQLRELLDEIKSNVPVVENKLFPYKSTDSLKNISKKIKSLYDQQLIDYPYTLHNFRKTAITKWANSGLSLYDVMTLAMHSDFRVTKGYYAKPDIQKIKQSIEERLN